jgi:hypothetical protein
LLQAAISSKQNVANSARQPAEVFGRMQSPPESRKRIIPGGSLNYIIQMDENRKFMIGSLKRGNALSARAERWFCCYLASRGVAYRFQQTFFAHCSLVYSALA